MPPLAASVLRCLNADELDLFLWNEPAGRVVLFREAGVSISDTRADKLVSTCGDLLYVRQADFEKACDHILDSLETLMADESMSPTDRYEVMQTALSFEVDKSLRSIDPSKYLALVARVGSQIKDLIGDNRILPSDLFAIAKHDSHTFAHVTNVAGYATVLAEQIGISDSDELDQITVGAMLHDIGKRFIPQAILGKPGRLTAEERIVIESHTLRGYEDLVGRDDVNHAQRMMVYQHHEHVNGKGYPVRVMGDEIHPWAKLLAVVDVFDALTGKRPYRKPMPMDEAVEFITSRAGTQFDKEMALCWVSAIKSN